MTTKQWIKVGVWALSVIMLTLGVGLVAPISGWYGVIFAIGMLSAFYTGKITQKPIEVIKEVIKEVPKEVIKTVEIIKEVRVPVPTVTPVQKEQPKQAPKKKK